MLPSHTNKTLIKRLQRKKTIKTLTCEEEEDFRIERGPLRGSSIKIAYSSSRPNGRLCYLLTASGSNYVSMPTVLVTGPTVTQNLPFLP